MSYADFFIPMVSYHMFSSMSGSFFNIIFVRLSLWPNVLVVHTPSCIILHYTNYHNYQLPHCTGNWPWWAFDVFPTGFWLLWNIMNIPAYVSWWSYLCISVAYLLRHRPARDMCMSSSSRFCWAIFQSDFTSLHLVLVMVGSFLRSKENTELEKRKEKRKPGYIWNIKKKEKTL